MTALEIIGGGCQPRDEWTDAEERRSAMSGTFIVGWGVLAFAVIVMAALLWAALK